MGKVTNNNITNMCNMQCKYCFAGAGISSTTAMEMEVVHRLTKIINEINVTQVCIDFHGGEPLTQKELMKDIVDYLEKNIEGKKIIFYVQTNGTLIDDEIAQFFCEHRFVVGVSIDGREVTNDAYRVMANGEGSLSRIMQGIKILKKWNIPFSCLAVVTSTSAMIEDYDFFVSNGIYNIQFMPVMPQGRAEQESIAISNWIEYANQELKLFNRVLDDRRAGIPVIHSSSYTILKKIMFNEDHNICMRRPCGAGQNILSIDENGDIFPCDSMSGIEKQYNVRFGNIRDYEHANDISSSEYFKEYVRGIQKSSMKCQDCFCKSICCGGCKSDVYNAYGVLDRETPMCEYYRYVIKGYFQVLHARKSEVVNYMKVKKRYEKIEVCN